MNQLIFLLIIYSVISIIMNTMTLSYIIKKSNSLANCVYAVILPFTLSANFVTGLSVFHIWKPIGIEGLIILITLPIINLIHNTIYHTLKLKE